MAVSVPPTSIPSTSVLSPMALRRVGASHYFDHAKPIEQWHSRVPALVYPALVGAETVRDLAQAKPADRPKVLLNDALTLGLPALGTVAATRLLMKPSAEFLPTTRVAFEYLEKHYPGVLTQAGEAAKALVNKQPAWMNHLLWGGSKQTNHLAQPLAQRLVEAPEKLLDVEVGQVIQHLRLASTQPVTAQRLERLLQASEAVVTERAQQMGAPREILQQGYPGVMEWARQGDHEVPQLEWPQRLREQIHQAGWLKPDQTIDQRQASQFLLKNELRLALPFGEEFDIPPSLRTTDLKTALHHTGQATLRDLKEEAMPFFLTGLASIGTGMAGGLVANRLQDGPKSKYGDIVNEGLFQFIANVCMCAVGATVGMGTANLLGLTKFNAPVARLGTIVAGLGAGITAGAASANGLSRQVSGLVDRLLDNPEPSHNGRTINASDMVLHLDDLPTALAIAGVDIFKPWIPPFFYVSAKKAAQGFRNVSPKDADSDRLDRRPVSQAMETSHSMIRPTFSGPATLAPFPSAPTSLVGFRSPSEQMPFLPDLQQSAPRSASTQTALLKTREDGNSTGNGGPTYPVAPPTGTTGSDTGSNGFSTSA